MDDADSLFLLQANVICIVYSVNNKKSIEKVGVALLEGPWLTADFL